MDQEPDYDRKPSKKSLYYRKRCFGMTGLERIQVKKKKQDLEVLQKLRIYLADDSGSDVEDLLFDLETNQLGIIEEIKAC